MIIIDSVRGRLTAWYTLVLAIGLIVAGTISYALMHREIRQATDASLAGSARQITAALTDEAAELHSELSGQSANDLLADFRENERPILLFSTSGEQVATSAAHAPPVDTGSVRRRIAARAFGFVTLRSGAGMRLLIEPIRVGRAELVLVVAQSLAAKEKLLADLRRAMGLTIPLVLLIASAGGYLLARQSLAPVTAMSTTARAIGATNLSKRIAIANANDELGQLAQTLNALLARLEEAFASQRRFMADASHELRTPVSILQGELDVTLSREDRDAREYRESLEIMRKSVRRLTRIVRDLFLLARGDAGEVPLSHDRFYLDEVVVHTVQGFRTLAAEDGVTLREEHDCDVVMLADEDLIQRMIGNLVENAIKNTPGGGNVDVICTSGDAERRIEVRDGGSGIPPELRERIFERFFRVDAAHGTVNGGGGSGAGLGLPIARWIAETHGGRLWLERSDANGSIFVATLPVNADKKASGPQ